MKSIIILTILSFIWINGLSQSEEYLKSKDYIQSISAINPNSIGMTGFDNRYEGIQGNPFIFEKYKKGTILFTDKTKVENIYLNINNYSNMINVVTPKNKDTLVLENFKINSIIIEEDQALYKNFQSSLFENRIKENSLFYVLKDDKSSLILVQNFVIVLKKAEYKGAYSSDVRYDEFIKTNKYYAKIGEAKFVQVKPKKNNMKKMFPEKSAEISEIFKKYKDLSNDELIIKLFTELYTKK